MSVKIDNKTNYQQIIHRFILLFIPSTFYNSKWISRFYIKSFGLYNFTLKTR